MQDAWTTKNSSAPTYLMAAAGNVAAPRCSGAMAASTRQHSATAAGPAKLCLTVLHILHHTSISPHSKPDTRLQAASQATSMSKATPNFNLPNRCCRECRCPTLQRGHGRLQPPPLCHCCRASNAADHVCIVGAVCHNGSAAALWIMQHPLQCKISSEAPSKVR